ncbi:uncharacterized protein LOC130811499 [Amaranthus tricolor]|uniref:uncharacterized protein LOC130811499 n=1 Tax=Amaranthus tricolor TaxID=29722 RepID=UPI00258BDC08|nr:uncharacterized protein LOC130811499 [Amaranthus tricolor]
MTTFVFTSVTQPRNLHLSDCVGVNFQLLQLASDLQELHGLRNYVDAVREHCGWIFFTSSNKEYVCCKENMTQGLIGETELEPNFSHYSLVIDATKSLVCAAPSNIFLEVAS